MLPEPNQYCLDEIDIFFPKQKQHYHKPVHSLLAVHGDALSQHLTLIRPLNNIKLKDHVK